MGRKKVYKNAAERQREWRIRTGIQKRKVPLPLRRGQALGASEADIRGKLPEETWEEYHAYILRTTEGARKRQKGASGAQGIVKTDDGRPSTKSTRAYVGYHEPEMTEDYYELRAKYELELEKLPNKGEKIKKKK